MTAPAPSQQRPLAKCNRPRPNRCRNNAGFFKIGGLILMGVIVTVLSACSTTDEPNTHDSAQAAAPPFGLMTDPEAGFFPSPPPLRTPVSETLPPSLADFLADSQSPDPVPVDAQGMPHLLSDPFYLATIAGRGSVEVFSLDQPLAADYAGGLTPYYPNYPASFQQNAPFFPEAPALAYPEGVPFAGDSSVTIFPFSDDSVHYAMQGRPSLTPPDMMSAPSPEAATISGTAPLSLLPQAPEPEHGTMPMLPPDQETVIADFSGTAPLTTVYFAHDSKRLDSKGVSLIETLAKDIKDTDTHIVVVGHASRRSAHRDPLERKIVNLKVSMDRALAVTTALLRRGVPAGHVTTVAHGESRPVDTETSSPSDAANRRVDIHARGH